MNSLAEQKLKLVAVALSGLLLLQLLWSGGRLLLLSAPDSVAPVGSVMKADLLHYRAPTLEGDSEVVERPLFWQGRKAFAYTPSTEIEESDSSARAGDSIDKMKLLGLYSGESSGVIVKLRGEQYRVAINESLEGWTLILTSADEAVFEKGGNTRTFELKHSTSKVSKLTQKPTQSVKVIKPAEIEKNEIGE